MEESKEITSIVIDDSLAGYFITFAERPMLFKNQSSHSTTLQHLYSTLVE